MSTLWTDIRLAARGLARRPAFAAAAILTMAIGIGANAALFSIVYAALLRPLPYRHADRLALIRVEREFSGVHGPQTLEFSLAQIAEWPAVQDFDAVAASASSAAAFDTTDGRLLITGADVSANFFDVVRGPMRLGRGIGTADEHRPVAVISDRLWSAYFGRRADAVGSTAALNGRAYTIVGIAAPEFRLPAPDTDFWVPGAVAHPGSSGFRAIARLRPGVSVTQADAALAPIRQAAEGREHAPVHVAAIPLREAAVSDVRPALLALFAAAGLIWLVACANVANLLLARDADRVKELRIRVALGASRGRLVQHAVAEAAWLAIVGCIAALGLAAITVRGIAALDVKALRALTIGIDPMVVLFAMATTTATALAVGVLPGLSAARDGAGPIAGSAMRGTRLRRTVCVVQVAAAFTVLVGALLLGRSLERLLGTDLGVRTDHVAVISLNLAIGQRITDVQQIAAVNTVIERVSSLPGVAAAGVGTALPPNASRVMVSLRRHGTDSVSYVASGVPCTPGYLDALRVRLLRGRLFTDADNRADSPPVMIMTEETARRFFPDTANPIGETVTIPVNRNGVKGSVDAALVGIIGNVKYAGIEAASADAIYRPFAQQPWRSMFLVVRTTGNPRDLLPTLRRAVGSVDRTLTLADIRTLDDAVVDATSQERFRTVVMTAIATLGLLLAAIGLYGVVAYSVSRRQVEIGVRMASGASSGDIMRLVVGEAMRIVLSGLAIGAAISVAAARALRTVLFGIGPADPFAFVVAMVVLAIIALAAAIAPASRAARVDPAVALRAE